MNDTFGPLGQAHSSSPKLCVYLLGPPRLEYEGRAWSVTRLQVRALLYYLASQERPIARERLAADFWPEGSDRRARRNLTHLLTHLRRELPCAEMVIVDSAVVALDPQSTWCDAAAFRELLTTHETDNRHQALEKAVALYGGSYLEGFDAGCSAELEAEIEQERIYLERAYLRALRFLIQHESTFGDYEAALLHARAYLDVDPFSEPIHGVVMRLYALSGQREQALRQFELCSTALRRELNAEPGEELLATRDAIRAGQATQWLLPDERIQREPAGAAGTFAGRQIELALLSEALEQATAGKGRVFLLSGESGIGKTRLLEECARRFANRAQVVRAECHAGTQHVPYYLAGRLLRSLLHERRDRQGDLLFDASWVVLELAQESGSSADDHAEHSWRTAKLIDSLSLFVVSLANATGPLLVCVDDLQWADAASLAWLNYLAINLTGARILLVGTFCCQAGGQTAEFMRLLIEEGVSLKHVPLEGLSTVDIRQLIHALHGQSLNFATCSRLRDLTGGNPFYLLSLLDHLEEQGAPLQMALDNGSVEIPADVAAAVGVRYQRLSTTARLVLDLATLLPTMFTFEEVQATVQESPGQLMLALEELTDRNLIHEVGGGFRLSHQLIRHALGSSMNGARYKMLQALLQKAAAAGVVQEDRSYHRVNGDVVGALSYR